MSTRLLVYDLECPKVQQVVLARSLRRFAPADWDIVFLSSEAGATVPWNTWGGPSSSVQRLACKVSAFNPPPGVSTTVYIDADCLVLNDLTGFVQRHSGKLLFAADAANELRNFDWFVIDHAAFAQATQQAALPSIDAGYEAWAAYVPPQQELFAPEWSPNDGMKADKPKWVRMRTLSKRPWYNITGDHVSLWVGLVREAIASGELSVSDIEDDQRAGAVRPSLLVQLRSRHPNDVVDPTWIDLDSEYAAPPCAVTRDQRHLLKSSVLDARVREFYHRSRLNKLKKKGYKHAASFGVRKSIANIRKVLRIDRIVKQFKKRKAGKIEGLGKFLLKRANATYLRKLHKRGLDKIRRVLTGSKQEESA